ncbi:MAG: hypothetical protein CSB13_08280 [Chloroflexi bacterium]|nr:MAG: hypothetical protein CSB13_08280 [Chloroflexota bacterium]
MKENISNLYDQITGENNGLQNLLDKIPGLSGYMEKGQRRKADQILRETLAGRMEQSRLKLSNVHQDVSRDIVLAMDYAETLGRADNLLMGLIGKIKDAPVGYAGFFDANKVKEDDLARIYAFDENMFNHAVEIDANIDAAEKAVQGNGDLAAAIRNLTTDLQQANQDFATRDEVIKGVQSL